MKMEEKGRSQDGDEKGMNKGETEKKGKDTGDPTVNNMKVQKNNKKDDKGKKTTTGKGTEIGEECGKKGKKETKTPSILKFFSRTNSEIRKNTPGTPVGGCMLVGEKLVGGIGVVDSGEINVKQQDPIAETCLAYGGESRHSSKGKKQQQHAVRQIIGRDTEIFHTGSTGQYRTGLEGNVGCTEQLNRQGHLSN